MGTDELSEDLKFDASDWRKRGNECARLGHREGYIEAEECYTKGINASQAREEFGRPLGRLLSCRAHVRLLLGGHEQAEAALADCREALIADPTDAKTFWRAAKASQNLGRLEQAKSFCHEGIAASASTSELQTLLRQLAESNADGKRELSCSHQFCFKESGISQFRADAIAACREAVAINPNDADAHCNLGVALDQADDDHGAVAAFKAAVSADPKHVAAQRNLGEALRRTGNMPGAVAAFEEALRLAPDEADVSTHFGLGLALGNLGDNIRAADCFRAAIALDPTNADAHLGLGIAAEHLQDFPTALLSFRAAVKAAPRNPAACYNFAVALEREAQSADTNGNSTATELLFEAEVALHTACALEPQNPDYHSQLGVVLLRSGKLVQAQTAFKAALEVAPQHEIALKNLAVMSEMSGESPHIGTETKSTSDLDVDFTRDAEASLSELLAGHSDVML